MKHMGRYALSLALFLALGSPMVWAQATAQISGSVTDATGALLPGVDVTATQTNTGVTRTGVSNETGSYTFTNLPIGPYRLEASLPGFQTFAQTGIVLAVNDSQNFNVVMQVGQVTQTIEVQAEAARVETRTQSVSSLIGNQEILELPLNGRQVTDLIALSGAAVQTGTSGGQAWVGMPRLQIAGGLESGVSYSLDGAMHNNPYDGTSMAMPFPDALEEFKVESTGTSAGSGMKSGGAVNAVTKSGTNEFHGDAFWFVRNEKFNARNAFAPQRDNLKRNQFGGTIGGPIVGDRLFFFSGYQGTTTRGQQDPDFEFVPTAAMLAGDWTAFAGCHGDLDEIDAGGNPTGFVNNMINPVLFSDFASNVVNFAGFPSTTDPCGEIAFQISDILDEHQFVNRVDYQLSNDHSIFGRAIVSMYDQQPGYANSDNLLTTQQRGFDNMAHSYAFGDTYLFSGDELNAFRLTVNRTAIARRNEPFFFASDLGMDIWHGGSVPHVQIRVDDGFGIGGTTAAEAFFGTTSYQLGDDINLARGDHQLGFGVMAAQWRVEQFAAHRSLGRLNYDGRDTGNGLADFMLGYMENIDQGSETNWATRQSYFGAYITDSWRATPTVTVNLGLRWEPFLPLYLADGSLYDYNEDRFNSGEHSTSFPLAPAGILFRGDSGLPEKGINTRWNNFGPRVGLAWDVNGDGRTSLRASYGIAYDFAIGAFLGNRASSPPHAFRTVHSRPADGEAPFDDFTGGNPFPFAAYDPSIPFPPFAAWISMETPDMPIPTVQSWNLSLQRQVGDWVVSGSYMGRQTTHMWAGRAINEASWAPGDSRRVDNTRRRLYMLDPVEGGGYSNLTLTEAGGTSQYHGLLLSAEHRVASGLNVRSNYTWSHCTGDDVELGSNPGESSHYLVSSERSFDRGNCAGDRRHLLNATVVASTPEFANPTLMMIASDWQLSGIYRFSTGAFLTLQSGRDRLFSGVRSTVQRPNQLMDDVFADKDGLQYLNRSAFDFPSNGEVGNMRTRTIGGPPSFGLDLALRRSFNFGETQSLEFRAEAFNVTNSLRRDNPQLRLSRGTFGRIQGARDPRIMQFAFKYVF